jgi:hypothetical protein
MQPCGCVCYSFCTPSKANIGYLRSNRRENRITSAEREKRCAASPGRQKIREISFTCDRLERIFISPRWDAVRGAQAFVGVVRRFSQMMHSAQWKKIKASCDEWPHPGRFAPENEKPADTAGLRHICHFRKSGAGEGIRTLDPDLGKVVLYH